MSKAIEDLTSLRAAFEKFQHNMGQATKTSVARHGLAKTAEVSAKIAHIQNELHELHSMMED